MVSRLRDGPNQRCAEARLLERIDGPGCIPDELEIHFVLDDHADARGSPHRVI